jgi:septum formation topological specificity factor MinE
MWGESLGVDYKPVTWVQMVKNRYDDAVKKYVNISGEKVKVTSLGAAIAETVKYSIKPSTVLNKDKVKQDRCVGFLSEALADKKRVVFTGVFRTRKHELFGKEDIQDGNADLIGKDEIGTKACPRCGNELVEMLYKWCRGSKEYLRVDLERFYSGHGVVAFHVRE